MTNDEKIMQLKEKISQKKKELSSAKTRFIPETNCLLELHGEKYNLHTNISNLLYVEVNMYAVSAQNLGIDPVTIEISGYPITTWLNDIKNKLDVQRTKEEEKKLNSLEKQLDALLSDDKQTELQIDALASLIG